MVNIRKVVVPQSGFTLIELVIVIIVLAIVSVFTGQFLSQNIDLYQRAVNQNERLSDARFIFNRMDKEFNSAIAFSVTDSQEQNCITFVPFNAAGQYLGRVANKNKLTLIMDPDTRGDTNKAGHFKNQKLSIFTTNANDFYANSADTIASIKNYKVASGDDPTQATVKLKSKLDRDSMVSRYFIFDQQVSYCLIKAGGNTLNLYRKEKAVTAAGYSTPVLMLSGLGNNSSMKLSQTTQVQHAMLDLKLDLLLRDNSSVTFNHQLVMTNVP